MKVPLSKRIAYVTSAFPHLTETFVLREICALEASGWDVTVFALKPSPYPVDHADAQRWKGKVILPPILSKEVAGANLGYLRRHPRRMLSVWSEALWWNRTSLNFLLRTPVILLRAAHVAREIEKRDIHHIHAHFATHPTLAALIAAELSGASFSATAHAHDIYVRQTGLREKLDRASFVACISDFNRTFLLDRFPELGADKLPIVRCGIDPLKFHPSRTVHQGGAITILCVASLQEYKGQAVLIDACADLVKSREVRCLLVGTGPLRTELEARVESLGLTGTVEFLGGQSEETVSELLNTADVFVAPSVVAADGQMDGIPVALMEAMAAGVPVVASALSGIPELVVDGQTGLLVVPGDAAALAAAIARLTSDPELTARLADAGREHVKREFLVQPNADRLARLFDGVLAKAA